MIAGCMGGNAFFAWGRTRNKMRLELADGCLKHHGFEPGQEYGQHQGASQVGEREQDRNNENDAGGVRVSCGGSPAAVR